MKGILIAIFAGITSVLSLSAQTGIQFRDLSPDDALKLSAVEKKPVMLMLYQHTCNHCERMLNEVCTDTAVANFYNGQYICVKQDMIDNPNAQTLLRKYYVQSFPTFVIMDGSGEVLYQYVGEFKPDDFILQGTLAMNRENQLPFLRAKYEMHPADSTACYDYLLALSRARLATQPVANMYFFSIRKDFQFNTTNWKIFSMSVSDMESDVFAFMVEHKEDFAKAVTIQKVDRKLYLTAAYNIVPPANANDTLVYYKKRVSAAALHLPEVDSLIFVNDLNICEKNKYWNRYIDTAVAHGQALAWNDATRLRRMAEVIYLNTDDPAKLQTGAVFAVRSVELKDDYFGNLAAAKIYLKLNDKEKAKEYANNAKQIGGANKMNIAEAELILMECQ